MDRRTNRRGNNVTPTLGIQLVHAPSPHGREVAIGRQPQPVSQRKQLLGDGVRNAGRGASNALPGRNYVISTVVFAVEELMGLVCFFAEAFFAVGLVLVVTHQRAPGFGRDQWLGAGSLGKIAGRGVEPVAHRPVESSR
jgi:hypothetical protein